MGQERSGGMEDEALGDLGLGEIDPRRRATLLEDQAEELRERLDALLAELGRHRRRQLGDRAWVLRYALPTLGAMLAAGVAIFLIIERRRRNRPATWALAYPAARARLGRLLPH